MKRNFAVISFLVAELGLANMVGTQTQNFNPTSSAHDYVTVHSSKTLGVGRFSVGLFVDSAINTLPYFDEESSEFEENSRTSYNDSVTASDLNIGFGVHKNLDVGLNLPAVLYQHVANGEEPHGEFSKRGFTEARLNSKVRFLGNKFMGLAAVLSTNLGFIEQNPYKGDGGGPGVNAELVGDVSPLPNLELAANIGYRWINSGDRDASEIEPFTDQFISSLGAAYFLSPINSKLIFELWSSAPVESKDDLSGRHSTRAEAITGIKIFGSNNFIYHAGAGTELRHAVATPDWRVYGGINWLFGESKDNRFAKDKEERSLRSASLPSRSADEIIVINDVLFKFDSDEFADANQPEAIVQLVSSLSRDDFEHLVIEGHTCYLGSIKYNKDLSQKRADRIRELLIKRYRFPNEKIAAVGVGERRPIDDNRSSAGRKRNRRVEFKIYRTKK